MDKISSLKKCIKPIIFYAIFFLFILAFSANAGNYDYDFWARLIAGMGVVEKGHVFKHDFLSYTPTHTWFDHEWGSGVIFYLTQKFFSSPGILFLQAGLVFSIFFVITKIVKLRGVKTTSPYNFLFYYFAFMSMNSLINNPIRCHLFTFLFFAVFLYILELARKGENRPLYAIPCLMIIWNNLHGGCVSGIGLILIYIVGELLNKKSVRKYIYALILSVLVLPINPWGFSYLEFLFKANTMQRADVIEWWGLFSNFFMFKYIKFKLFALILILMEFGLCFRKLFSKEFEFDKTKFLVLLVTLVLAIQHVKLVPFAVISFACFLYDDFYTVFNFLTFNIFNKIAKFKDAFVYFVFLIFIISNLKAKAFEPMLNFSRYPVRAVEFIKINGIKGNLQANFGLGSYVSYKLYPNNKIFMDGRYEEVYYDDLVPMMKNFSLVRSDWDEILRKFPPDVILIEKFYPVFETLKAQKEWKKVFEDEAFGVFVPSLSVKQNYLQPSKDIVHYKNTLFDTDIKTMIQSKHEQN